MAFGMVSLEKRLSNNIKNYSLDQLFQIMSCPIIWRLQHMSAD